MVSVKALNMKLYCISCERTRVVELGFEGQAVCWDCLDNALDYFRR